MLSTTTLARAGAYRDAFAAAQPFRHIVIDDFLEPPLCQRLLDEFPAFDRQFALNEMGEVGGKAVRTQVRDLSEAYRELDDGIRSDAFLQYVSQVTGIPDLLYDPDYEGGGTHENRHGQGLDPHIDFNYHPRTGWHRRLNLIVYLNPEWQADWGGALQLHADPWSSADRVTEALPLFNRCVIFETNEVSWHGFDEIRLPDARQALSRKSFAIYLYTRERPAEQTAPPHATVYVPAGMPEDLAEGSVLDAERLLDLRSRFARLRGQMRFLYEREKQFGQQIEQLQTALAESRAAQRGNLEGYARVERVDGLWADDWSGREACIRFVPSRPVRALTIELWVPPQLAPGIDIGVRCADQQTSIGVAGGERRQIRLATRLPADAPAELRLSASADWVPGAGGDTRSLSFRLLVIRLEH